MYFKVYLYGTRLSFQQTLIYVLKKGKKKTLNLTLALWIRAIGHKCKFKCKCFIIKPGKLQRLSNILFYFILLVYF